MNNFTGTDTRRKRNGFTLVELCVVIALLAIVTVMMLSFSLLMEKDAKKNQAKSDFMEEVSLIRREMKDWFAAFDQLTEGNTGRTFKIEKNVNTVSVSTTVIIEDVPHPDANHMTFDSDTSVFVFNNLLGNSATHTFDTVESVKYEIFENKLLKCIVTGSDGFGESFTQTFMISLRFGTFTE